MGLLLYVVALSDMHPVTESALHISYIDDTKEFQEIKIILTS